MAKKSEKLIAQIKQIRQEPANKLCFDCGDRGPQYVCLPFSTFVCMTCSGLHREFNHRVKGINASEFTDEEVAAIRNGGNEAAKTIYLARYVPSDFPMPDASTPPAIRNQRLKEFMRLKYIDRRWVAKEKPAKKAAAKAKKPEKVTKVTKVESDEDTEEKEPPPKPTKTAPKKQPVVEEPEEEEETTRKKPVKTKAKPEAKVKPKAKEKHVVEDAPPKKASAPVEEVASGIDSILDFGAPEAHPPEKASSEDDWATFDTPQTTTTTTKSVVPPPQSEWGVFTAPSTIPQSVPPRPASFIDFQVTSAVEPTTKSSEAKAKATTNPTTAPPASGTDFFAHLMEESTSPPPVSPTIGSTSAPTSIAPSVTSVPPTFMPPPTMPTMMTTTPPMMTPPTSIMPTPVIPPMTSASQWQTYQQQMYQQQMYQQQLYYYHYLAQQAAARGLNSAGMGGPVTSQPPTATTAPPSTTTSTASSSGPSPFDGLGFL